jgi:hypothetical protein
MKSFREIQAEEQAAAAEKAAADARAKAEAEAAAKSKEEAKAAAKADAEARIARGEVPCWLCKRDLKRISFHPCKEKTCPRAPIAYTRFDRWGNPNTAYPAHPLREYYSAPGVPSHSNNFYSRAFREYDEEMWREKQRKAKELKEVEDLTGLKGDAAVLEYKRVLKAPARGLCDFLGELV